MHKFDEHTRITIEIGEPGGPRYTFRLENTGNFGLAFELVETTRPMEYVLLGGLPQFLVDFAEGMLEHIKIESEAWNSLWQAVQAVQAELREEHKALKGEHNDPSMGKPRN